MLLRFFYDFLTRYFEPKDFEPILADTDSMYVAFSSADWEQLVRPEFVDEFKAERHNWLPRPADYSGPPDPPNDLRDNRTPGLFHIEFTGDFICALNPKTYLAEGPQGSKLSTKGVQKRQNSFSREQFKSVL